MRTTTFLLLAMLLSFGTSWAQEAPSLPNKYLWHASQVCNQEDNKKKELDSPSSIIITSDGNLILTSYHYTFSRDKTVTIFRNSNKEGTLSDEVKSTGDNASKTSVNGNPNSIFYKIAPDGKYLWRLHSTRGYTYSNQTAFAPTPDGGFLAYLAVSATAPTEDFEDIIRFVQPDGTDYDVKLNSAFVGKDEKRHRKDVGLILKVDGKGMINFSKVIVPSHDPMPGATYYTYGTPSGISMAGSALDDEGNMYFCGSFRMPLTIDGKTYKPKNIVEWSGDPQASNGDFYVMKMAPDGKVLAFLQEKGAAIAGSKACKMIFENDKLYIAYTVQGTASSPTIKFGEQKLVASEGKHLGIICTDKELKPTWGKSNLLHQIGTVSSLAYIESFVCDAENFYVSGRMQGGFKDAKGNWVIQQPHQKHTAYALAFDRDGNIRPGAGYINNEKNISNAFGLQTVKGKVLFAYYLLFGDMKYELFDAGMKQGTSQRFTGAQNIVALFGAAVVDDRIVMASRVRSVGKVKIPLVAEEAIELDVAEGRRWACLWVARGLELPTMSFDLDEVYFGNLQAGEKKTMDVVLKTKNLEKAPTLTLEGDKVFSIDPTSITMEGGNIKVTVAIPTDLKKTKKYSAKLIIKHGLYTEELAISANGSVKGAINTDKPNYDLGTVTDKDKEPAKMEVAVTGKNLENDMSIMIEGDESFSLDKKKLPKEGGKLVVSYKPTDFSEDKTDYAVVAIRSGNTTHTFEVTGNRKNVSIEKIVASTVKSAVEGNKLRLESTEQLYITIFDLVGKRFFQSQLDGAVEVELPRGTYILSFGSESRKIIIS